MAIRYNSRMAELTTVLNARQLDVLRWIAAGCPDREWPDHTYKGTAVALQNRRLVTISKKRGTWAAAVTPAGQAYLDTGERSIRPKPRRARQRSSLAAPPASGSTPDGQPSQRLAAQAAERPPAPASALKELPPTEKLVADVAAADGELHVRRRTGRPDYETQLVATAIRFGKVPTNKLLTCERGATYEDLIIRLEDKPSWATADRLTIRVPATLRGLHPLVQKLGDSTRSLPVTGKAVRSRALRLMHALVTAAERQGYKVQLPRPNEYGHLRPDQGQVRIVARSHGFLIRVIQQMDRTDHVPTATELRRKAQYEWTRIPDHDYSASDRLTFKITSGRQYRRSSWSDGKRVRLEDCLAEVLHEVELSAHFAEQRRLEQERQELRRRRQREEARAAAEVERQEAHRGTVLLHEVERWQKAQALTEYLKAMRTRIERLNDAEERASAMQWYSWATRYREQLDPLGSAPRPPSAAAVSAETLTPHVSY